MAALGRWLGEGRLQSRHDIVRGTVEDVPDTLLRLFGARTPAS
ncbi:hypothetical protein [Pseudonocardia acidicola]|nr:hypothetical protein [Pseudonocardia acidicola]